MNKRLKKRKEKRLRESIHRVLDLALDINGLRRSKQALTGNHPTAFIDFCGHTASIYVQVYKNGWFPNSENDFDLKGSVELPEEIEKLEKELRKIKEDLKNGYKH